MKNLDKEINGVLDVSIKTKEDLSDVTSLRELYDRKRDRLKLSDRQIQNILGMTKNTIESIIDVENKQVSFINMLKVAHFLGLSINDLAKLYIPELGSLQIGDISRAREAGFITETFDVASLTKLKFLERGASTQEISDRLQRFFNIDSIYYYSDTKYESTFRRSKGELKDLMKHFWVKMALRQFELIDNPYRYDKLEMLKLIPKIGRHTLNEKEGIDTVIRALYAVGVTVIYQPNINKMNIRGATMEVNAKPCIVLSDDTRSYADLWFTLMHELFHVMYDFDDIKDRGYHLSITGASDLSLIDDRRADEYVIDYFLDESKLELIEDDIQDVDFVNRVAKDWGVHPSIIYMCYFQYTGDISEYHNNFVHFTDSMKRLSFNAMKFDSLMEVALKIKKIIEP